MPLKKVQPRKPLPQPGSHEDALRSLHLQILDAKRAYLGAKSTLLKEMYLQQLKLFRRRRRQLKRNPGGISPRTDSLKPIRRP